MKKSKFRLIAPLLGVLLLGGVLASCGDSEETSSSSTTAGSGGSGASCGEPKTVGLAAITLQSPAVGVQIETAQRAADLLGWELVVTNADGDPAKMAADISGLVNQGVDAILDVAIQPAQALEGMRAAQDAGIPVIGIGAPLTDPQGLVSAVYDPSDAGMSNLLAEQMIADNNGEGKVLSLNATGIPALEIRRDTLLADTADTDIVVVVDHETDLSNAVQDTQTAVANALRANPDINIIWALQDFEFAVSYQTMVTQDLTVAGIYGYYPPPEAFELMRNWKEGDAPMAAADSPIKYSPWYAFDALVNKFVLEESDWVTDMSIKPLPLELFTPANVPSTDYAEWEPFEPFFVDRWEEACGGDLAT